MSKKYTSQQIEQALKNLPEELKEAVFSMETADAIWNACTRQKIIDERMTKIAEYTGYVLMGLMLPQEFEQILQKEIKLSKRTTEELSREINRFIFYPVEAALEKLYKIDIVPSEKPIKTPLPTEEKPKESPRKDVYRELVE